MKLALPKPSGAHDPGQRGEKCCAVTEIADYARARALVVVQGGGDMAECAGRA